MYISQSECEICIRIQEENYQIEDDVPCLVGGAVDSPVKGSGIIAHRLA